MSIWINYLDIPTEQLPLAEICNYSEDSLVLKGMGIYHQIADGIRTRMNFSLTFLRRVWGFTQHAYIEGYFGHPNFVCLEDIFLNVVFLCFKHFTIPLFEE